MKCAEESVMERSGCEGCGQAGNVATEWVVGGSGGWEAEESVMERSGCEGAMA